MRSRLIIVFLLIYVFSNNTYTQNREHLFGIKTGYNISAVSFDPVLESKPLNTYKTYSISYIYFHELWNSMPYFGLEIGLDYQEQGYKLDDITYKFNVVKLPLISKFHYDFSRFRIFVNLGTFFGYRLSKVGGFDDNDYKIDLGFLAGGGVAVKIKPFEIHIESNYNYSFTNLYNPETDPQNIQYTYPNQLVFNIGLFFNFSNKR